MSFRLKGVLLVNRFNASSDWVWMNSQPLAKTPLSRFVIGCPLSWSFHPLACELEKRNQQIQIQREETSSLLKQLESGQLASAFVPTMSLVRQQDFEMALPLGIALDGPSGLALWGLTSQNMGLKVFIDQRLEYLRELFRSHHIARSDNLKQSIKNLEAQLGEQAWPKHLPPPMMKVGASASSWNALAKLLYRLVFGPDAYESWLRVHTHVPASEEGNFLDLRIDNEALQKRCSFRFYYDLSEIWRNLSGLPFVSHVLQKPKDSPQLACRSVQELLDLAQMRMQVEPCTYLPDLIPRNCQGQGLDLCLLWKSLRYRLEQQDIRSILVFLRMVKPLEKKCLEEEAFTLKMLRWQGREALFQQQFA